MLKSSHSGQHILVVAKLSQRAPTRFALTFDDAACAKVAQDLDALAVRKLTFTGDIRAQSQNRWQLRAKLGATVDQPCVVTWQPVTTRIDQDVVRVFVPDLAISGDEDEVEIPQDDSLEPLADVIDLQQIMTEALSLYLPDYPRAADAALPQSTFAAPGIAPMSDADAHPFAGLAKLKDTSSKKNGD